MVNFGQLIQTNRHHDRVLHRQNTPVTTEDIPNDFSCSDCYPTDRIIRIQFEHFWNWYQSIYPAASFSGYTQNTFAQLLEHPEILQEATSRLLASIRYSSVPETAYSEIQEEFFQAYNATQAFWKDPTSVLYTVSEYTDSRRSSQIIEGISRLGMPQNFDDEIDSDRHPAEYKDYTIEIRESDSEETEQVPLLQRLFRRNSTPKPIQPIPMAAQAADIQALTTAVQALTGQFRAPNWVNVQMPLPP